MEPTDQKPSRASVKVCLGGKCRAKGADDIYHNLKEGLSKEEALVEGVHECFGFCAEGPNIAVNDNIIKGVKPFSAVGRVQNALRDTSCKADGLGARSLDCLDTVLDDLTTL